MSQKKLTNGELKASNSQVQHNEMSLESGVFVESNTTCFWLKIIFLFDKKLDLWRDFSLKCCQILIINLSNQWRCLQLVTVLTAGWNNLLNSLLFQNIVIAGNMHWFSFWVWTVDYWKLCLCELTGSLIQAPCHHQTTNCSINLTDCSLAVNSFFLSFNLFIVWILASGSVSGCD